MYNGYIPKIVSAGIAQPSQETLACVNMIAVDAPGKLARLLILTLHTDQCSCNAQCVDINARERKDGLFFLSSQFWTRLHRQEELEVALNTVIGLLMTMSGQKFEKTARQDQWQFLRADFVPVLESLKDRHLKNGWWLS